MQSCSRDTVQLSALALCAVLPSPAGLETFISTAKKLPCPALYDVVEGYIKISMECAEVFKLLEGEKHVESEVSLHLRATLTRNNMSKAISGPCREEIIFLQLYEVSSVVVMTTELACSKSAWVQEMIVCGCTDGLQWKKQHKVC